MMLEDAQDWLRNRVDDGARCPCCNQFAKIYKRKLTESQVGTLRRLLDRQRQIGGWVHLPDVHQPSRDFATTAYFGLSEQSAEERPDGGKSGYWMVTSDGINFLRGRYPVHKYARIYDGRCLGYEGDQVTVDDIAPQFRLDELMSGI